MNAPIPQQPPNPSALVRSNADWERVEVDYRIGQKSLREIASEHSITEGSIRKRAKRDAWERDLNAKVQAKADALVRKAMVRNEVRKESPTEREIVEGTANQVAAVALTQRKDINRGRVLAMSLFTELEAQCSDPALLGQLSELLRKPDDKGADKLNDIYNRIIGLPSRVGILKTLTESLARLVTMEREAYGMESGALSIGAHTDGTARIQVEFVRPAQQFDDCDD